jgi:hypothetical protein
MTPLPTATIHGDRRDTRRYQLDLDLSFRELSGRRIVSQGAGRISDISSGGVLFHTSEPPAVGSSVELFVRWPCHADNGLPLTLLVVGRVIRSHAAAVAVRTVRHEFRSAGSTAPPKRSRRA